MNSLRIRAVLVALACALMIAAPGIAKNTQDLEEETRTLREQLNKLTQQMEQLQERLQKTEDKLQESKKEQDWNTEDIDDLNDRLAKAERHTASDKLELGVELESQLWSIQMQDVRSSYEVLSSMLPALEGVGLTDTQLQTMLSGEFPNLNPGQFGAIANNLGITNPTPQALGAALGPVLADLKDPPEIDVDNDAIKTLRFRLRMDAEVNEHLRFAGRIAAYKIWGDSVGINFNKSGLQDVTLDGTTTSDPHGDTLHLERAYFVYNNQIGNVPWYFSIGRRPSTEGAPMQYKKNLPGVGGSPYAHIINWQFDGGSLHFDLSEVTGIPGFDIKFCYGTGFESEYGTTSAFLHEPEVDDVDLYGLIGTLYEDYLPGPDMELSIGYNYAYAPNITDGFTGLSVMPFIVSENDDGTFSFSQNTDEMFISRLEPSTNIGDWQALALGVQAHMLEGKLDLYLSGAWSHTKAEKVSEEPLYKMLGMSLLSSGGELESHDGYSVLAGTRYHLEDFGTKIGLEYNYGSKYWFNFTGAEENLIGSKLATRGHVIEPYLIQSIVDDNFFLRLGAQFYKFNYSGSGNPLGKPVDVDDVTGMETIFPVIDQMQQYYLSIVYRF